jgi:predicted flap endonuclease-1-like 5' DNA nuclease
MCKIAEHICMVKTPPNPSDRVRSQIDRATDRILEDPFNRRVGAQKDDLTDIDGVGDKTARTLSRNGFSRIKDVADEPVNNLAQAEGISRTRAEDIKDAAHTANRADFEELEDIDGVGPEIARKLNRAGIRDPHELRGKSQQTLAAIDGIGPKRAARIRADVEYEAPAGATDTGYNIETTSGSTIFRESRGTSLEPFDDVVAQKTENIKDDGVQPAESNIFVKGEDRQEAIAEHAERSEESRRADESFNAPIMLDRSTWERNKDEYDYPGVDTIPRSRKLERVRDEAARIKEAGMLGNIEASTEATNDWRARGQYSLGTVGVDTTYRRSEDTLAHELGHAVDDSAGRPSGVDARGNEQDESIFDDPAVLEQARGLSEQRRGKELDSDYLESQNEVFADLYAEATINPRRAKKEAPDAFRALQDAVGMDTGFF